MPIYQFKIGLPVLNSLITKEWAVALINTMRMPTNKKKVIPEMMPVKKWLTLAEACAFVSASEGKFRELAEEAKLQVSFLGRNPYYRVDQINDLFERNIQINR